MKVLNYGQAINLCLQFAKKHCGALEMMALSGPLKKVMVELYQSTSPGAGRYSCAELTGILVSKAAELGYAESMVRPKAEKIVADLYANQYFGACSLDGFYIGKDE